MRIPKIVNLFELADDRIRIRHGCLLILCYFMLFYAIIIHYITLLLLYKKRKCNRFIINRNKCNTVRCLLTFISELKTIRTIDTIERAEHIKRSVSSKYQESQY